MKRKMLGAAILLLLTGLMLCLFSCGAWADTGVTIDKFMAAPAIINTGETTTLSWKVSNASHIEILGFEKDPETELELEDTLEVWPMTTTTYVLIAYGTAGKVISKAITVNVGTTGNVTIEKFEASSLLVNPSETVTLSWKATNCAGVRIRGINAKEDEEVRDIEDSVEVWPQVTTTYIMEAIGLNGEVASASITVNVSQQIPKILTYTADKTQISRGEMVKLSWTTENVVKCSIVTSDGATITNRPPNGSISVTPNRTKSFTLIAYDASNQEVRSTIQIVVK